VIRTIGAAIDADIDVSANGFRIRHPRRFFIIYAVSFFLAAELESRTGGRGWILGSVVVSALVLVVWSYVVGLLGREKQRWRR
jgi:hypothetical protein